MFAESLTSPAFNIHYRGSTMEGLVAAAGSGLMNEVKAHPWTTVCAGLAFFGLIAAIAHYHDLPDQVQLMSKQQTEFANKQTEFVNEMKGFKAQFQSYQNSSQYSAMDHELRLSERTLFELKTAIDEKQKTGRPADSLYLSRLQEVQSDHDSQERKIKEFLRAHPDLVSGSSVN